MIFNIIYICLITNKIHSNPTAKMKLGQPTGPKRKTSKHASIFYRKDKTWKRVLIVNV